MDKAPELPKNPPKPKVDKPIEEVELPPYEPNKALIYRQEFDRAIKFVDERIANTNFMMGVIIVVLLVGFVTLLVSVIGIFGQYIGLKTNSEIQLINTVNELNKKVDTNQVNSNLQDEKKEPIFIGK